MALNFAAIDSSTWRILLISSAQCSFNLPGVDEYDSLHKALRACLLGEGRIIFTIMTEEQDHTFMPFFKEAFSCGSCSS